MPKCVSHDVTARLSHEICQGLLFVLQAFFPILPWVKKMTRKKNTVAVGKGWGEGGILLNLPSKCECPKITEVRKLGRGRGT